MSASCLRLQLPRRHFSDKSDQKFSLVKRATRKTPRRGFCDQNNTTWGFVQTFTHIRLKIVCNLNYFISNETCNAVIYGCFYSTTKCGDCLQTDMYNYRIWRIMLLQVQHLSTSYYEYITIFIQTKKYLQPFIDSTFQWVVMLLTNKLTPVYRCNTASKNWQILKVLKTGKNS